MSNLKTEPGASYLDGPSTEEAILQGRLQEAVGSAFQVRDRLGRGGVADVFEAFDPRLKRTVALKVLRPELSAVPELQSRFRREAESIASVRHPNILPIHAIGEGHGIVYLVLERVEGRSLKEALEGGEAVSTEEAVRILKEIGAALAAAHSSGIVHRDLKPANVMLDGPDRRVRLMDFGVARAIGGGDGPSTQSGVLVGTPHYMSPEQAAGDVVDPRADLYALGVLGYELVTGRPPFRGTSSRALLMQHLTASPEPIRVLRPDCPRPLADVIERCLAKSPEERYTTADEVVEALSFPSPTPGPQGLPGPQPAQGREEREGADTLPVRRFFRSAGVLLGLTVVSIGVDLAATGSLTFAPFVAVGCVVALALVYGDNWRGGHSLGELWRPGSPSPGGEAAAPAEFGRHAAAVTQARLDRANIVRGLARLTRQEQERAGASTHAADRLVARVIQQVRQLQRLDERIGAERGEPQSYSGAGAPSSLLAELLTSRDHLRSELDESLGVLRQLRDQMARAGSDDSGELGAALEEALRETRRLVRG